MEMVAVGMAVDEEKRRARERKTTSWIYHSQTGTNSSKHNESDCFPMASQITTSTVAPFYQERAQRWRGCRELLATWPN